MLNSILPLLLQVPGAGAPVPPPLQPRAEVLLDHVRVLAADGLRGREAGSQACRLAGEYLALHLSEAGLEPAMPDGWFQSFRFLASHVVAGPPRLALGRAQERRDLVPERDFVPLSAAGSGEVQAELVFAGYGLVRTGANPHAPPGSEGPRRDDYEGIDARGRVVVVLDGDKDGGVATRDAYNEKIYTAKAKGAAAILVVAEGDVLPPYRGARTSAGLPAFLLRKAALEGLLPPLVASAGRTEVLAGCSADLALRVEPKEVEARNVVARVRGSDPKLAGEYVVLGAHYDHLGLGGEGSLAHDQGWGDIHNGADDNASGCAVILEVGRLLHAQRASLRRSVLIVGFSAEEKGLLGSRWFVDHPPVPRDQMVAMVNLDMVGRSKDGYLAVIGAGTSPDFARLLASHGTSVRLGDASFGGSDHQSFIASKIPAVHFFTGTHADYHKPGDDIDKLNVDGMVRVGGIVYDLVTALANQDGRPPFVVPTPPKPTGGEGKVARAWIGTIPDYVETKGGVKLSGVSAGSPAEKAGLKAGDVLIKLGDKAIGDIYDFTYALRELEPGQKIAAHVRRGETVEKIEITVGKR